PTLAREWQLSRRPHMTVSTCRKGCPESPRMTRQYSIATLPGVVEEPLPDTETSVGNKSCGETRSDCSCERVCTSARNARKRHHERPQSAARRRGGPPNTPPDCIRRRWCGFSCSTCAR